MFTFWGLNYLCLTGMYDKNGAGWEKRASGIWNCVILALAQKDFQRTASAMDMGCGSAAGSCPVI